MQSNQPFLKSFQCAFTGIAHAFIEGRNFKVQVCFAVAAIVLGIAFSIDALQWIAIAICIGGVLAGECMNTAMEAIVDLASPDYHELARIAKDCAAGGVLVMAIASVAVAAFIFLPKIAALVGIG